MVFSSHNSQEGTFACTVTPQNTDFCARIKGEIDFFEYFTGTMFFSEVGDCIDVLFAHISDYWLT